MEMTKVSKEEKILLNIHQQLFKESIPIADFNELLNVEDYKFKQHSISMLSYHTIVEELLKGKKLTDLKKATIRNILNKSETLPEIKRL